MDTEANLRNWVRQPSSWLSLIAAGISLWTFLLVYACPGDLLVALPDRVGINRAGPSGGGEERLHLLLPLTLTNTGAPRTWTHITRVMAQLESSELAARAGRVSLAWELEHKFVGKEQFLKKYPDTPRNENIEDYIDYEGRAFPFALKGGESTTRLFELRGKMEERVLSRLRRFELFVTIETSRGQKPTAREFRCTQVTTNDFQWCSGESATK